MIDVRTPVEFAEIHVEGWLVHPGFLGIAAFVGAGLVFAGVTDACGMGLMLAKMPWNRVQECGPSCSS